ncbi:MAG: hypothetical protein ABW199_13045 [Caulobacterales bacterium]
MMPLIRACAVLLTPLIWGVLCSAADAAPVQSGAGQLGSAPPLDVPIARIFAGLLISALVAFIAVLVLKRRTGGAPLSFRLPNFKTDTGDRIAILETRRLSPHADICRFTSAGKEYLVIVTTSGASLIRERDAPSPSSDDDAEPLADTTP